MTPCPCLVPQYHPPAYDLCVRESTYKPRPWRRFPTKSPSYQVSSFHCNIPLPLIWLFWNWPFQWKKNASIKFSFKPEILRHLFPTIYIPNKYTTIFILLRFIYRKKLPALILKHFCYEDLVRSVIHLPNKLFHLPIENDLRRAYISWKYFLRRHYHYET